MKGARYQHFNSYANSMYHYRIKKCNTMQRPHLTFISKQHQTRARFFLHLFTVLFGPLRAKAFFDMLPLDHPPPGLCWFVLCTSCGFCFDLPRDHPMFGVHLLSFAPLWVFGFLLNLFWARFRPSTRPRHAWGSLRFFAQGSFFWTSFGPCFDLPRDHPMLGVFYGLHTVLFGPLLGPVLTFHATTPCLGFITVCTRFFLNLFWAVF